MLLVEVQQTDHHLFKASIILDLRTYREYLFSVELFFLTKLLEMVISFHDYLFHCMDSFIKQSLKPVPYNMLFSGSI